MSDLVKRLPKMLRKNAELDAKEGEYNPSEHIEWMAADRIEELEATALKWADSSLQKTERIEELEAELNRAKNDPGLFFTGDRDILEQNQKIKAECERLREFLERGGIDSSAVLAGEDTGEWQDQNERLRAVLVEVHRLVSYAQHRDAINLINKALAVVEASQLAGNQARESYFINRIEELEAELKATQENEHRLAEANKPLLARACKAEAEVAGAWHDHGVMVKQYEYQLAENERLRAVYEAAKELPNRDGQTDTVRIIESIEKALAVVEEGESG